MMIGAIVRTVRLRRLLNIAAPLRPDRGCLGMNVVGSWWPRPDSNRHSGFPEADFKSAVSTVPPRGQRARVPAPLAHLSRFYQTCTNLNAILGTLGRLTPSARGPRRFPSPGRRDR